FHALFHKVMAEELHMIAMLMEVTRRQHGGEHGHFAVELHTHQTVDNCCRHKLVAINAAVDDQGRCNHGVKLTALRQLLGHQGNLQRTGHAEMRDVGGCNAL